MIAEILALLIFLAAVLVVLFLLASLIIALGEAVKKKIRARSQRQLMFGRPRSRRGNADDEDTS